MPVVSVITPVYNRGPRLRATVESVLTQSWRDFEYLLVDDGSGEETQEVLSELAARDPRIRCIRRENHGAALARAHGLELARGEYVAFLDHDDAWMPEKLEQQVAHLASKPDEGWVYCRIQFEREDGEIVGDFAELFAVSYWAGWVETQLFRSQNFIATYSAPMIRTDLLRRVGGPEADTGISDDWDLFIRLAAVAPLGFVDRTLVRYNCGNPASQSHNLERALESERSVIRKHVAAIRKLPRTEQRAVSSGLRRRWGRWAKELGWRCHREGDYAAAIRWYGEALRLAPGLFSSSASLRDLAHVLAWRLGLRGRVTR